MAHEMFANTSANYIASRGSQGTRLVVLSSAALDSRRLGSQVQDAIMEGQTAADTTTEAFLLLRRQIQRRR